MNRISIFLVFLCSGLSLAAQKKTAPVKPQVTTNGRNINITLTPLKNCKVYLGSYMGKGKALVDSAMLNDKTLNLVYTQEEGYVSAEHAEARSLHVKKLSGTQFRPMLRSGEEIPEWFAFRSVVEVLRSAP